MQQLDNLIDHLTRKRRWSISAEMVFIIRHYSEIVGPNLNKHTSLKWIKKGVACIHCRNAMWSYALKNMEQQLIEKMNSSIGYEAIKRLIIRIGNISTISLKETPIIELTHEELAWIELLASKAPSKIKEQFRSFLVSYKELQHQ